MYLVETWSRKEKIEPKRIQGKKRTESDRINRIYRVEK